MDLNAIQIGTIHSDGVVTDPDAIEFECIVDNDVSQVLQSTRTFNNSEFDYKFIIETNTCPDIEGELFGGLFVVKAFRHLPKKRKEDVKSSICDDAIKPTYYDVYTYGLYAPIEQTAGTMADEQQIIDKLKEKAPRVEMLLGFYLDRPVNRIGSTGWEFLIGDLGSAMKRLGA